MTTPEATRIRVVLDELHVGVFPPAPYLNGTEIAERIVAVLTPLAPEVPPREDGLREALERLESRIAEWKDAEIEAADRNEWSTSDRFRYLAGGMIEAVGSIREALAVTPEPPDSGDGAALDPELLSRAIRAATLGTRVHVSIDEARVLAKSVAYEYGLRSGSPAPEGGE